MSDFRQLPEEDKPREKLATLGPSSLTNRELLAILLRTGTSSGSSVLDVANDILEKADQNIENLFKFSIKDLQSVKGIGEAKATTLIAAFELAHRLVESQKNILEKKFSSPQAVFDYFSPRYSLLNHEEFNILILNNANRLIKVERISQGILNSSLVHPREVFNAAIQAHAASIILLHNHPSGEMKPSQSDIKITRQLIEAGKILDIPVLDHVIIAKNGYYSFKENNMF